MARALAGVWRSAPSSAAVRVESGRPTKLSSYLPRASQPKQQSKQRTASQQKQARLTAQAKATEPINLA
uniref:Uncharacterized protein n=1 Tax=Thermogemmatispora argillosa TaxID=2045280 RepID=A0A455T7B7_9CHLR|nr:hypothetical protein KTA_27430 [Thermogemmatispora argillosa]